MPIYPQSVQGEERKEIAKEIVYTTVISPEPPMIDLNPNKEEAKELEIQDNVNPGV